MPPNTTNETIDCEGRDLQATLDQLRTENAFLWRMDVLRVSAWRLHIKRPASRQLEISVCLPDDAFDRR